MAALLPLPEIQALDAIGRPYAAGTLETYIPATSTPKPTWNDPAGGDSHLNTNPVVLDSAGRAIVYGDGLYRLVLRDVAGNLVYDQPSSTLVSAAMAPVIIAPTIAEAVRLLGIQDMIDASVLVETTRAEAAEAALTTALAAEVARAEAAEAALSAALAAEIARAEAAEAALGAGISGLPAGVQVRTGAITTDGSGRFTVTFSPAFPTGIISFLVYDASVGTAGFQNPPNADGFLAEPLLYMVVFADIGGTPTPATRTGAINAGVSALTVPGDLTSLVAVTGTTLNYIALGW